MKSPFKWDWYQATVRDQDLAIDPHRLVDLMGDELGGSPEHGRGLNGYEITTSLRSPEGQVLAKISYGGRNLWPNVMASSDQAPALAQTLRMCLPRGHWVTRADVAYDVQGADAYASLRAPLLAAATAHNLKVYEIGDPREGSTAGRTTNVGARTSVTCVRLYEKGLELRAKALTPEAAEAIPADLVRLELECKPQKAPGRAAVALMEPEQVWGCSRWTKLLAADVLNLDVERVALAGRNPTDDERAMAVLARQYGRVLAREAERLGGWDVLGLSLGRTIERDA